MIVPEIGVLKQVEQSRIRIASVSSGTVRPMAIQFANIEYPAEVYDGETTVSPSQQRQTLNTRGKILLDDVTIEPVPENYGLITWNGSVITVS